MEQLTFFNLIDSGNSWNEIVNKAIEQYVSIAGFPKGSVSLRENKSKKDDSVITSFSIVLSKPDYPKGVNTSGNICNSLINIEEDGHIEKGEKVKNGDITFKTTSSEVSSMLKHRFSHLEVKTRKSDNYYRIKVLALDPSLPDIVMAIIDTSINRYIASGSDSFGCCHLYKECSDAKKCLHENLLYARGCMYYYNLVQGRIFFGNNRNIT